MNSKADLGKMNERTEPIPNETMSGMNKHQAQRPRAKIIKTGKVFILFLDFMRI